MLIIDDCWNKRGIWAQINRDKCEKLSQYGHCRNCPVYIDSGRTLLDRPMEKSYQDELIGNYKKKIDKNKRQLQSMFVFKAGDDWFALGSHIITKVLKLSSIHSIPHKNSRIIRGITNIHGQLQLCLSIGGILRIKKRSTNREHGPDEERLLVATKNDQSVVFPVSKIIGQVRYCPTMMSPLPVSFTGAKAVYSRGVIDIRGEKICLLDENILFKILTRMFS